MQGGGVNSAPAEPGEPNAGCQSSGLAARDARPRFHLQPALKLPEQHFHFSAVVCILMIPCFAACIEVPHRAPAFACIFTFHLQRASWPPAIPFPLFCSRHYHEPCLGGHGCILHAAAGLPEEALWSNASAQFICTLQLWCPRRSCGRMHPHSSSALCSRAARGGPVVECIRTVHLHSAAVLPKEVLWSTCGQMHPQSSSAPCSLSARVRTRHKLAGTGFSCTLQPFSPRG